MEAMPYFIGLAAVLFVCSFGLQQRKAWVWHLGWTIFYTMAGYFGTFFNGLYLAKTQAEVGYAFLYLVGGMVIWIPAAVWWTKQRQAFGPRVTQRLKKADGVTTAGSEQRTP